MKNFYKKLMILTYAFLYHGCCSTNGVIAPNGQSINNNALTALYQTKDELVPIFSVVDTDKQNLSNLTSKTIPASTDYASMVNFCFDLSSLCVSIADNREHQVFHTYCDMYEAIANVIDNNGGMSVVEGYINNPIVPTVLRYVLTNSESTYTRTGGSAKLKYSEKLRIEALNIINNHNCLTETDCKISDIDTKYGVLVAEENMDDEGYYRKINYLQRLEYELHDLNIVSDIYGILNRRWGTITEILDDYIQHNSNLVSHVSESVNDNTKTYLAVLLGKNQSAYDDIRNDLCMWLPKEKDGVGVREDAVENFIVTLRTNCKSLNVKLRVNNERINNKDEALRVLANCCFYTTRKQEFQKYCGNLNKHPDTADGPIITPIVFHKKILLHTKTDESHQGIDLPKK